MPSKHAIRFHHGESVRERDLRVFLDVLPYKLERRKSRVSFVQVVHLRVDSETSQQPYAADAQDLFLHDTRLSIAAVKVACDQTIDVCIFGDVGVKQIQRQSSDTRKP